MSNLFDILSFKSESGSDREEAKTQSDTSGSESEQKQTRKWDSRVPPLHLPQPQAPPRDRDSGKTGQVPAAGPPGSQGAGAGDFLVTSPRLSVSPRKQEPAPLLELETLKAFTIPKKKKLKRGKKDIMTVQFCEI